MEPNFEGKTVQRQRSNVSTSFMLKLFKQILADPGKARG